MSRKKKPLFGASNYKKKKPKKPIVKNDKGKWVWVSDEDVQEKHELDDK